jgi:hypothetical protein
MHSCGHFLLLYGQNCETDIHVYQYLEYFLWKCAYLPPGVTLYKYIVLPPAVWQFILKKYYRGLSKCISAAILYYYEVKWSKMTPNWKAAVIIPIYGVIFGKTIGNLEPRGDHIYGYPHCFEIIFQLT